LLAAAFLLALQATPASPTEREVMDAFVAQAIGGF
jgi:hypothetical protein